TYLWNFFKTAVRLRCKTKSVTPYNCSGMNGDLIANFAIIRYFYSGVNYTIIAYAHIFTDISTRKDLNIIPDSNILTNKCKCTDEQILAHSGRFGDIGGLLNSTKIPGNKFLVFR